MFGKKVDNMERKIVGGGGLKNKKKGNHKGCPYDEALFR